MNAGTDKEISYPRLSAKICGFLFYALEIIVEHAGMTNQAHLFRHFDVGRSDHSATPGTEDLVHGWLFMVLRMEMLIQFDLP